MTLAVKKFKGRLERYLLYDTLEAIISIFKCHPFAVRDDKEPDLTLKLYMALKIGLLILCLAKVHQVAEGRTVAHLFACDAAFRSTFVPKHLIPRLLLEHEQLQAQRFVIVRALGQKLDLCLDSGNLILCEGHLGAEGPPIVQIHSQVGRASHKLCLNG